MNIDATIRDLMKSAWKKPERGLITFDQRWLEDAIRQALIIASGCRVCQICKGRIDEPENSMCAHEECYASELAGPMEETL